MALSLDDVKKMKVQVLSIVTSISLCHTCARNHVSLVSLPTHQLKKGEQDMNHLMTSSTVVDSTIRGVYPAVLNRHAC